MSEDFGEPWVASGSWSNVVDRDDKSVVDAYASNHSADRNHINTRRIIDCVNFLAGVPSSTLTGERTNAVLLALAVLHGDETAAYALADLVKEEGGGGPVPIGVGDVVMVDPVSASRAYGELFIVTGIEGKILQMNRWLCRDGTPGEHESPTRIDSDSVRRVGRCPWAVEPK